MVGASTEIKMSKNRAKNVRKKKLLAKMLLLIGGSVLIVFCVTILVIITNIKQSVNDLTNGNLTAESQEASYQINNYFTKYAEIARQMAGNAQYEDFFSSMTPGVKINEMDGFDSIKTAMLNVQKTDPDNIAYVWIADVDSSQFLQSDGSLSDSDWDITTRSWYNQIKKEQKVIITEPYLGSATNKLTVSVIAPVYKTGTKTLLGVTAIDFTLDGLYQMVSKYTLGDTGFYMLASSDGQLIYYPDKKMQNKNVTEAGMSDNIVDAMKNKKSGIITYTAMGKTNNGYVSAIGDTGWVVATGLPQNEFNRTYNNVLNTILIIFIVAIIILAFIIILLSKSIVNPLKKLQRTADDIADGNLDMQINVKTNDEIGQVAVALSRTVDRLKEYKNYIDEITTVLDQIAVGNLVFELKCEYVGEFTKIKASMENIRHTLSSTFYEIGAAADQVASGSEQVSTASQTLAQGATEQAAEVEKLSTTMVEIAEQAKETAQNANDASQLSNTSSAEVESGNEQMKHMISAMDDISKSSSEIGKIIKAIEDIAFQTNILALNAAIEAARAGSAGRGFAVVADEVRNLANKSTEAAQNTAVLIQSSMESVENGTKIAQATARSLDTIIESTKKTTDLINKISQASNAQAVSIQQVTQGADQIAAVVQTNSATSEESAASSEELNAQAQTLKTLISNFRIENDGVDL